MGAFNCQGAGWDSKGKTIKGYSECYKEVSGSVRVKDIEWDQTKEATEMGEAEEYAVYLSEGGELFVTTLYSDPIQMTILPSSFEIYSFTPIKKVGYSGAKFAPIGLTNMFNCGGTVLGFEYEDDGGSVKVEVKGEGNFLAYSSVSPKKCSLNGVEAGFQWCPSDGKLVVSNLPWIEDTDGVSIVSFYF